ncbi:MAG: xanthine dehydrogenase family protein molybdopterin-binding subunit [Desulfomonile tiedjei]|uniref:Xanthine dehydrogenase family protein molybdopterin-binding subunit n=1 Tax=Desulfomonile tiedjei TaxID=2358 RepID=A0A9D6V4B9_9BACT|nr:xanthine dehydrogenase family protein molybdopterin-binding subunit [Desulfomonile tiedjei]
MGDDYRFIGKATQRRDAVEIVTGTALYLDDLRFQNLLHGKVLRSPHAHALIKKIDKSKAEALPGVKAVLTWQDIPDWKGGTPRKLRVLDKKVRYVGDAVALVAASTEEIAREALDLIEVEYQVLPAVLDMDSALKHGAPLIYDEFPGNIIPGGTIAFGPNCLKGVVMGDVEKGFAEADVIAEGTFGYENIPNALPPEPVGAVAMWEEPNKVTLWSTSQAPYMDKGTLFHVFNRQVEIRCIGNHVGGSFGTKIMCWQVQAYAVLLSRATGKPVKVMFTKEEHMAAFTLRIGSRIHARVGMKKDGTLTAIHGTWYVDSGYYSFTTQAQVAVGSGELMIMAQCPNWDLKNIIVATNRNASGSTRGFGGQELKCSFIPILSLAMEKAALDPFEVLKKNYVKPGGGYFWRDGNWYQYRGIDYSAAMDKGAEQFGWKEKWKGWLTPTAVNGTKRLGIGVGVHGNADVGEDSAEAYVQLDCNGTATIFLCAAEHGTGQKSNYAKLVAEVLQIPLDRISMTPADSLITPFEFGPVGSRGTYAIGSAVINAAEDVKRRLFEFVAPKLGAEPQDLETVDGVVFVKGYPEKSLKWRALGYDRTLLGHGRFEPDFTVCNCMMSFVEVEVDTETGKVTLLRVVLATDVGQIIDPQGLEGQLNGALGSAGIDSAIFEETILNHSTGHILNANLMDYKWRTFTELPAMEHVVLETPMPTHRFHAVGVGEVATSPGPSAVLMAVSNAVGSWLHEYPVTPDRVLRAIGKVGYSARGGKK